MKGVEILIEDFYSDFEIIRTGDLRGDLLSYLDMMGVKVTFDNMYPSWDEVNDVFHLTGSWECEELLFLIAYRKQFKIDEMACSNPNESNVSHERDVMSNLFVLAVLKLVHE